MPFGKNRFGSTATLKLGEAANSSRATASSLTGRRLWSTWEALCLRTHNLRVTFPPAPLPRLGNPLPSQLHEGDRNPPRLPRGCRVAYAC